MLRSCGGLMASVVMVAVCIVLCSAACADIVTADLYAIADASGQYWKDITGTTYSGDFQSSFSYNDASVSLGYYSYDDYWFRGSLSVSALKPDFCYQVKLNGKPEGYWDEDSDDTSNEALGYAGRWWRNEPDSGNANDSDYEAHKDDPGYVYTGYLLFDFFVTDENGTANIELVSDNSYHVVWKTSQRTRQANDGPVREYMVDETTVGLYGEWEPGRALPGELALHPGPYDVQFVLTEESFHDSGAGWATVMGYDNAKFGIAPEPSVLILMLTGIAAVAGGLGATGTSADPWVENNWPLSKIVRYTKSRADQGGASPCTEPAEGPVLSLPKGAPTGVLPRRRGSLTSPDAQVKNLPSRAIAHYGGRRPTLREKKNLPNSFSPATHNCLWQQSLMGQPAQSDMSAQRGSGSEYAHLPGELPRHSRLL